MAINTSEIAGSWYIDSMELWDRDYLDLEVRAHLTFDRNRLGSFQFGAVRGGIDYRLSRSDDHYKVEFTWEGFNDADMSSGRGYGNLIGGHLEGRFFFHNGDDSAFLATRNIESTRVSRRASK